MRVRRIPSDGPAGEVLEQSPEPGERISADTVVILTVSKASVPERVTVPRVEGLLDERGGVLARARQGSTWRSRPSAPPSPRERSSASVPSRTRRSHRGRSSCSRWPAPPEPVTVEVPRLVGLDGGRGAKPASGARPARHPATRRIHAAERDRRAPVTGSRNEAARGAGGAARDLDRAGPAVRSRTSSGLDEESAREQLEAAGFEVQVVDEPTEVVEEDGIVARSGPGRRLEQAEGERRVTITVSRFG